MTFDLRDWRALACGYGVGVLVAMQFGNSWWVPASIAAVSVLTRIVWR